MKQIVIKLVLPLLVFGLIAGAVLYYKSRDVVLPAIGIQSPVNIEAPVPTSPPVIPEGYSGFPPSGVKP